MLFKFYHPLKIVRTVEDHAERNLTCYTVTQPDQTVQLLTEPKLSLSSLYIAMTIHV
jgi:hypothetical protein